MNLDLLLARLKDIGVEIIEQQSEKGRAMILQCALPFPFARKQAWYPLTVKEGQTEIPKPEVLAILRHLWHLSKEPDFFPEDWEADDEEIDAEG